MRHFLPRQSKKGQDYANPRRAAFGPGAKLAAMKPQGQLVLAHRRAKEGQRVLPPARGGRSAFADGRRGFGNRLNLS